MGHIRRSNTEFEENPDAEVHRRLHAWGLWLYSQDNPGLDIDPVNMLGKYARLELDDRDQWRREAEAVDSAVKMVAVLARPIIGVALKSRYEYVPEYGGVPKKERQAHQLEKCQVRTGRALSGSRFRQIITEGRRLVACQLPWIEAAKRTA
ncbi:MAG: hypothetical protein AAGA95_10565 [Pseudomonadota bacterium]